MTLLDWLWQTLLAIAFGVGSAVVPVLNAEAYVIGAGVSGKLDPVAAAVGVSIGQAAGKLAMFLAVRYRPGYAKAHDKPVKPLDLSTRWGRWRQRVRDASRWMLGLLGDVRYGLPVTLLSSFVGIPPLYAVALIAGASRMSVSGFGLAVLAGRAVRFVLIALGVSAF
jgi:membrane protein YqaA with SNARE-associated domain